MPTITPQSPGLAKYGQPACPNAPNPCYCNGACQGVQHIRTPWVSDMIPPAIRPATPTPMPDFLRTRIQEALEKSRREREAGPQVAAPVAGVPQPPTTPLASANPEDYYKGTSTLDNMIAAYGKEAVRQWCIITCHKYITRMGLKEGNSLDQEKKKALWYLAMSEKLTRELQQELDNPSIH